MAETDFEAFKSSTAGIIVLGFLGSLLAAAVGFGLQCLRERHQTMRKADAWDFGWVAGFSSVDVKRHLVFVSFALAHVAKLLLKALGGGVLLAVALILGGLSVSIWIYAACFAMFVVGSYLAFDAVSAFRILQDNHTFMIKKLNEGEAPTQSQASRAPK